MNKKFLRFSSFFLLMFGISLTSCDFLSSLYSSLTSNNDSSQERSDETFTVTWLNYDGTVLEIDENVPYGTLPTYDGETPKREPDMYNTYTFAGWSPKIDTITHDTTYIATYEGTEQDLIYELNEDGDEYIIVGVKSEYVHSSTFTTVTIPSKIGDIPVTTIGGSAFATGDFLEEIIFEEESNISIIESTAFEGCISLKSISFPDSLTYIGHAAFRACQQLTSIYFSENSKLNYIGDMAFTGLESLTTVYIPSSLVTIDDDAFSSNENLSIINIASDSQLTTISDSAFSNCQSLTSIYIPKNVETIGTYAFYGCTNLNEIIFEEDGKLSSLPNYVFAQCINLVTVDIPSSINTISNCAFLGCTNLTTVNFDKNSNLTSIGAGAFRECTSLESIIIPHGTTSIRDRAFQDCTSLSSIYLPSSLIIMGYYVFKGCENLTIYSASTSTPTNWDDEYKEEDTLVMWRTNYTNEGFIYSVQSGEISIKEYVGRIKDITIPDYIEVDKSSLPVTTISNSAFQYNTFITSVVISNTVTSIGSSAFSSCSSLTSIYIPSSVVSMSAFVFQSCYELTIYCEAESQPSGRSSIFNYSNCEVVWGVSYEKYLEYIS